MNERIRALADQADRLWTGASPEDPEWCEKFAELIIRECANLPFKDTGEVTTIGEIAVGNRILRHFGLEE